MPETRVRKADFTPEQWAAKLERTRRWRQKNAEAINAKRRDEYTPKPRVVLPPVPVFDWDDTYRSFVPQLNRVEQGEFQGSIESNVRDMLQEAMLALLEGRDPVKAMKAERNKRFVDLRILVHGLAITDGLER